MTIHVGDCLTVMPTLGESSIDSIVTDPPYGLSFMNSRWDHAVPGIPYWAEALRVAKPGAHLFAFGGTRTFHRLMCAIEDAGWEYRETLLWIYGTGMPKSKNFDDGRMGTALKPAWEPIIMARKPFKGGVIDNVGMFGTGALNIDDCRIKDAPTSKKTDGLKGRWPANVLHDGSEVVLAAFPSNKTRRVEKPSSCIDSGVTPFNKMRSNRPARGYTDKGSVARFFYSAKASPSDRHSGLDARQHLNKHDVTLRQMENAVRDGVATGNTHPTVKPTELMRWLCRLITPPGGMVLDPFCGSGSTGKAAVLDGYQFIGIEADEHYASIARQRIYRTQPGLAL